MNKFSKELGIDEDALGCLGAVMLLILDILFEGLIFWGLGSIIIWCFNLNIVFHYWQAIIVGLVIHTILVYFGR